MEYLVTFYNHMQAVIFSRRMEQMGYHTVMMPLPRRLSANCGTAVRFTTQEDAAALCRGGKFQALYRVTREGYRLILSSQ